MTDHDHTWEPIPMEMGRYACSCGATGYRNKRGTITVHRTPRRGETRWTAMDSCSSNGRKLPTLDETERKVR